MWDMAAEHHPYIIWTWLCFLARVNMMGLMMPETEGGTHDMGCYRRFLRRQDHWYELDPERIYGTRLYCPFCYWNSNGVDLRWSCSLDMFLQYWISEMSIMTANREKKEFLNMLRKICIPKRYWSSVTEVFWIIKRIWRMRNLQQCFSILAQMRWLCEIPMMQCFI